jgi:hypothetical protein
MRIQSVVELITKIYFMCIFQSLSQQVKQLSMDLMRSKTVSESLLEYFLDFNYELLIPMWCQAIAYGNLRAASYLIQQARLQSGTSLHEQVLVSTGT